MDNTPIKLKPAIKDYIWGGRRLIDDFNKKTELDKAAESWAERALLPPVPSAPRPLLNT